MPTFKQARTGALGLVCAAVVIVTPFIHAHEGDKLTAYLDTANVWTVCSGEAHVAPGTTMTPAQCQALTASRLGQFATNVATLIRVPITAPLLAAHTSFAYNIGMAAYGKSQTLAFTNAGRLVDGCKAMLNWFTAGGLDCRKKANNCTGLITRRNDEVNLCLQGAQP